MSDIKALFFELIRVAIGTQTGLSRLPSEAEWEELFDMAVKQSLVGVCYIGLHRLGADSDDGFAKIGISEELYFNWIGMAAQINIKNETLNRQCVALQKRFAAEGIGSSILKGQGIAALYGEELCGFRQSGDIDIYVDCGRAKAIEYARSIHNKVDWDYKHLHLNVFDDTQVEMHYVPEVFINLRKNRKLQMWFKKPEVASSIFQKTGDMVCPSVEFNLFYILLHAYWHFLYEGVGMRQLMDYFIVLRNDEVDEPMKRRVYETITLFGLARFASGVMWIMKAVFGMPEQQLLCEQDEKEGHFILGEVMTGGNFGKYKEKRVHVKRKIGTFVRVVKYNGQMLCHYPENVFWTPIYFIWHKCWKFINS